MRLLPALALLSTLGFASVASAATLKVPSDDYPTIQSAVDAAVEGDLILLAPGTYTENVVIEGRTGLTIGGKKAIIDGSGGGSTIRVSNSSEILLAKLVVIGGTFHGVEFVNSSDSAVIKSDIHDVAFDGVRIEQCTRILVEKNAIHNVGGRGVGLESAGGALSEIGVSKNKIYDTAGAGIKADGSEIIISRNTLVSLGDDGIHSDPTFTLSGCIVEKNKITGTTGAGVNLFNGFTNQVSKNKLKDLGGDGIALQGSTVGVDRNKIENAGGNGITMNAFGAMVGKNKIKGTAGAGVAVNAGGGYYEKNNVSGAAADGFNVTSSGNGFVKNKAKGSGETDLDDITGTDSNTYEKNKFGTESITGDV